MNGTGQTANAAHHAQYNRLRWRCRRGMRELDTVLLRYLESHYSQADERQQQTFEYMLDMPDPELYFLLMGKTESDNKDVASLVGILRTIPRH